MDQLKEFQEQVLRWNQRINLIGRTTTSAIAERHIQDSLQLYALAPSAARWCDMGSGAGFPGLVVAICAKQTPTEFILIEADRRKAAFLSHISRMFDLNTRVIAERIERVDKLNADVVSARALAPLGMLLDYGHRHAKPDATFLFPKGASYRAELDAVRDDWRFSVEPIQSKTSDDSVILKIKDLARA
nr:16S rRNA (guanine(527)-N(7))-methyltransferase RsmG [Palleronia pontilimi]